MGTKFLVMVSLAASLVIAPLAHGQLNGLAGTEKVVSIHKRGEDTLVTFNYSDAFGKDRQVTMVDDDGLATVATLVYLANQGPSEEIRKDIDAWNGIQNQPVKDWAKMSGMIVDGLNRSKDYYGKAAEKAKKPRDKAYLQEYIKSADTALNNLAKKGSPPTYRELGDWVGSLFTQDRSERIRYSMEEKGKQPITQKLFDNDSYNAVGTMLSSRGGLQLMIRPPEIDEHCSTKVEAIFTNLLAKPEADLKKAETRSAVLKALTQIGYGALKNITGEEVKMERSGDDVHITGDYAALKLDMTISKNGNVKVNQLPGGLGDFKALQTYLKFIAAKKVTDQDQQALLEAMKKAEWESPDYLLKNAIAEQNEQNPWWVKKETQKFFESKLPLPIGMSNGFSLSVAQSEGAITLAIPLGNTEVTQVTLDPHGNVSGDKIPSCNALKYKEMPPPISQQRTTFAFDLAELQRGYEASLPRPKAPQATPTQTGSGSNH